jgi:uncharacterized protein with von Willebrand factor type A (vWA) domain
MSELAQAHLLGFHDALQAAGLSLTPNRRADFSRAMMLAPLRNRDSLYWVARVTLVASAEQMDVFDAVFNAWFGTGVLPEAIAAEDESDESEAENRHASGEAAMPVEVGEGEGTGSAASHHELLHRRTLDRVSQDERELWLWTRRAAEMCLPIMRGRRRAPGRIGTIDVREVLRDTLRNDGEIVTLAFRRRPDRQRRVLVLIDVSGSLKANSPANLRFAHALVHGAERAEVFTFGTRLTRITSILRHAEVDEALARLSSHIFDFDGGTRIGVAFDEFLANSRFLALARGALIIIISDGLERGDPALMAAATRRISRLGHRLVWLTPLLSDRTYRPVTRGMRSILDDLDYLGDGSSGEALLAAIRELPALENRPRRRAAAIGNDHDSRQRRTA